MAGVYLLMAGVLVVWLVWGVIRWVKDTQIREEPNETEV